MLLYDVIKIIPLIIESDLSKVSHNLKKIILCFPTISSCFFKCSEILGHTICETLYCSILENCLLSI